MRRAAGIVWALTVLIGVPTSAPLQVVDWTYLFKLFSEIRGHVETSSPDDLKAEFDRICGQVPNAPSLTEEQLQALIEDCKTLREALAHSEDPQAKIFLKRLQMCEDFFEYSLEVKK